MLSNWLQYDWMPFASLSLRYLNHLPSELFMRLTPDSRAPAERDPSARAGAVAAAAAAAAAAVAVVVLVPLWLWL